jgi:hypothetical protein
MCKIKCPKCGGIKVRTYDGQGLFHPDKETCQKEGYDIDNTILVYAKCDGCDHNFDFELPVVVATTGQILELKVILDILEPTSSLYKTMEHIINQLEPVPEVKDYRDDGHIDSVKYYTEKQAISVIKALLKDDAALLDGRDVNGFTDSRLLEIGFNFYSIYKE